MAKPKFNASGKHTLSIARTMKENIVVNKLYTKIWIKKIVESHIFWQIWNKGSEKLSLYKQCFKYNKCLAYINKLMNPGVNLPKIKDKIQDPKNKE